MIETMNRTIETPRLLMRPHTLADYAATAAMWAEPAVVKYISGTPSTPEQSYSRLLRYAGHWEMLGYGYWVVEDRASGRFIGEVGFADYRREIDPPLHGMPELGWALAPDAHGHGYATEAVKAAI